MSHTPVRLKILLKNERILHGTFHSHLDSIVDLSDAFFSDDPSFRFNIRIKDSDIMTFVRDVESDEVYDFERACQNKRESSFYFDDCDMDDECNNTGTNNTGTIGTNNTGAIDANNIGIIGNTNIGNMNNGITNNSNNNITSNITSINLERLSLTDNPDFFDLSKASTANYNQITENERRFGIKADYDETFYTNELDKNSDYYKRNVARAKRIEKEIIKNRKRGTFECEERYSCVDVGSQKRRDDDIRDDVMHNTVNESYIRNDIRIINKNEIKSDINNGRKKEDKVFTDNKKREEKSKNKTIQVDKVKKVENEKKKKDKPIVWECNYNIKRKNDSIISKENDIISKENDIKENDTITSKVDSKNIQNDTISRVNDNLLTKEESVISIGDTFTKEENSIEIINKGSSNIQDNFTPDQITKENKTGEHKTRETHFNKVYNKPNEYVKNIKPERKYSQKENLNERNKEEKHKKRITYGRPFISKYKNIREVLIDIDRNFGNDSGWSAENWGFCERIEDYKEDYFRSGYKRI